MEAIEICCPWCEVVVADVQDAAFAVLAVPTRGTPGQLLFECPSCGRGGVLAVGADLVEVLQQLGVRVPRSGRSAHPAGSGRTRVSRRPHRPDGPPVTWDDLLDFHLLLERDDWFERLVSLVP